MKKSKKLLALILVLVSMLAIIPVAAAANDSKTVSMLCYNVAGLPNINYILGKEGGIDVNSNQKQLGEQLNASGYDIIAVQEDFTFHSSLASGLTNYPYKTIHSGGIPGGDGMNVYSKSAIYNEKRTPWDMLYGVINDGADEMTPKGILYTCIDLGDGFLVDLYDIHADAYDGEGSRAARRDNFRQLKEMIDANTNGRPIIVTGDFNISVHHSDDNGLYETLIEGCGFKDAWIELYNNGNYSDFSEYINTYGASYANYWGIWDSVEKYLYRDGDGVTLTADSFNYKDFLNADGNSISDHKAAEATFTFTKTADFKDDEGELSVTQENKTDSLIRRIFVILIDFFKALLHLDEALAYLGI